MKKTDLSHGLKVGPEPHFDVISSNGVVVAQAPHGIHTQVLNADWKRHARLFALAPKMVRKLQDIADRQAFLGGVPADICALIDDAVTEIPELKRGLVEPRSCWDEDDQYPVEDWRREVAEDNTRSSYLEWVQSQREMNSVLEMPPPSA